MKKIISLCVSVLIIGTFFVQGSFAQLSGVKTIPGNYATIAAAITDLNSVGVGSGGVTFNIAAGYTETASNLIITATGTSANPIIFQKSGTGNNPKITAGVGVGTMDGVILLSGSDYVTFDGLDLLDPTTNTTTTTQMEWGFALLKIDGTNGSQYNTIKNCNITLQKTNTSSVGIYAGNHTTTSTTALTVTARTGANSGNKFYSNTIQNCYSGITMAGYADGTSPYQYYDHFNEIGVSGGNTIRYFGGSSVATYGIYTTYQDSINVSNNNIAGGTGSTSTSYGIYLYYGYTSSATVYNNTVQDTTATTTGATYGIALYYMGYNGGTDNTIIVKKNTVQGMTSTAFTSGTFYGYYLYYIPAYTLNIDSNNLINNKWGGTSQTATGTIYGMYVYPYTTAPASGSVSTFSNNYMAGNKRTQSAISSGTLYGMYFYYGGQTVNAYNNVIENDTLSTTTGASYYFYIYNYYGTTVNYYNNAIRKLYKPTGSSTIYMYYISNAAYSGTFNFYNNTANNFKAAGTASASVYGIYNLSTAPTKNFYSNTAYTLQTVGAGSVYGIYNSGGTTVNIYKNSVYDLRTSSGFGYGLTTASGTTVNLYNNFVSDIRVDSLSTTLALMGLYISGGTTVNAYYNTVYLNSVSLLTGSQFGTAALYVSSTPTVDLRNNVIINASTPGTAGGYTTAHYRSSGAFTTFPATANNNCYYAGTPDTNHIIYYDGTNYIRTLSDYKFLMAPRELLSVTELPPFTNTTTRPYDLRINAAISTQLESTGQVISSPSIVDDFDGQARYPNTGYPINSSYPPNAPDMGADEFGGIPKDIAPPAIVFTPLPGTPLTTARTLTATIVDLHGVPTTGTGLPVLYWKINAGSYSAVVGTSLGAGQYSFTFGAGVATGNVVYYYICAQDSLSVPNVGSYPSTGASGYTANPPACSTPPTNPCSYTITTGLSGDYTVGLTLFNKVTGRNLYFVKEVKKVKKTTYVEETIDKKPTLKGREKEVSDLSASVSPFSRKEIREVEEISWIPYENGKVFKGELYIRKSESPNYSYPDGINGIYASLTAAIADLDLRGVSGATRFLLNDTVYSAETYPLNININNTSLPTSTNTITIKPNTGITSRIYGAAVNTQIFKIRNNYVTIDGSNTTNGTTRNLTIQNTSTTTPQTILIGSSGTTPITNITVKNCTVINGVNSSSSMIISDGSVSGSAGYFNNITVQNNSFQLAYMGIYSIANILSGNGSGLLITGNDFNTPTSPIRLVGIYIQGVDGATISNNNLGNDSNTVDASNITGIWFATGTVNSTISGNTINNIYGSTGAPRGIAVSSALTGSNISITGNTLSALKSAYSSAVYGIYVFSTTSNVSIRKNKVSNLLNTSTGGYGVRGINIATSVSPSNIEVVNNFVWDMVSYSYASLSSDWNIGIAIDATITGVTVYDNSVNLFGTFAGYASATVSAALYISSGASSLNIRNNILVNSYNNTAGVGDKSYAIYTAGTSTAFTDINYNDYYASDSAGTIGYLSAAQTTLAAWRTATGKDLLSVSGDPKFVSNTNLHIDSTQVSPVTNAGQYIATVTDDIDGNIRYNPPDIGADESTALPPPVPPICLLPANNATGVSLTPLMDWDSLSTATGYRIQINTDSTFAGSPVFDTSGINRSQITVPAGKLSQLTKYYWRVNATNTAGTSAWSNVWNFTTLALPLQLNLKVYLEGFWDGSSQVSDTVGIYLALATTPHTLVDSQIVILGTTGTYAPSFSRVTSGNYYIVIKHRNHLETWSALPQAFVGGLPLSYDFTTDSTKAFGMNMRKVGSVWALIVGDANQDGSIDASDVTNFLIPQYGYTGYLSCDFNGDGSVDASDIPYMIANYGLAKVVPSEPLLPPEIKLQKRANKLQELDKLLIKKTKKTNNNNNN